MRRSGGLELSRTRDELYAQARVIGIHGRAAMTKAELASAIRRATAPTRAFILVRAARRRATAVHAHARAALDSAARLARTLRLGLALPLTSNWRFRGENLSIAVALVAVGIGGAIPVLVYGMNPKSAEPQRGNASPVAGPEVQHATVTHRASAGAKVTASHAADGAPESSIPPQSRTRPSTVIDAIGDPAPGQLLRSLMSALDSEGT